jgi:hypothetical protein
VQTWRALEERRQGAGSPSHFDADVGGDKNEQQVMCQIYGRPFSLFISTDKLYGTPFEDQVKELVECMGHHTIQSEDIKLNCNDNAVRCSDHFCSVLPSASIIMYGVVNITSAHLSIKKNLCSFKVY